MLDVKFIHLGIIPYKEAWDYQEKLLAENLAIKKQNRENEINPQAGYMIKPTHSYFILCEHYPVFTLGKSGHIENLLVNNQYLKEKGIEFYQTNRGGDITFHGLGQIVGYPILDLERLKPDIVKYMRDLEEVIILTLQDFGIQSGRSQGETGVWLDAANPAKARKICAMGVKTSRWITMHGFALNVNTDLSYFEMIIPCGISNKKVTSMEQELKLKIDVKNVENKINFYMVQVFGLNAL